MFSKKLMVSKKKTLVDFPKGMAGPKSPEDPFQYFASFGIFIRLFEVRMEDAFFINVLLKDSFDELSYLDAGWPQQV